MAVPPTTAQRIVPGALRRGGHILPWRLLSGKPPADGAEGRRAAPGASRQAVNMSVFAT
jgi:hypothetical protein